MRGIPGAPALLILALLVASACGTRQPAPVQETPVLHGVPEAPSRAVVDEARARGIAFLLANQNPDGPWGHHHQQKPRNIYTGTSATHGAWRDATTGLCLTALIPPARTRSDVAAAVDRAARYLFARPPALRSTPDEMNSVWTQVYTLEAAAATLADPRLAVHHDAARRAATSHIAALGWLQGAEGGFGYYDFNQNMAQPSGKLSTSFTTGAVLVALHRIRAVGVPVPDQLMATARRSLERMRTVSGSYAYSVGHILRPYHLPNQVKGAIGRIQVGNLALFLDGVVDRQVLRDGLDAFFAQHHFIEMGKGRPYPHEAWYATAGYYFFFGHYYAGEVARLLPAADATRYRDGLASILCRLQDPDGSWWDFPLYGYHKPYGTAFALMTLENAAPVNTPAAGPAT